MLAEKRLEEGSYEYPATVERRRSKQRNRRRRKRCPETVVVCGVAFLFAFLGVLYIGQQVQTMRLSIQLTQLQQEFRAVQQQHDFLQLSLSSARALPTIETIARTELGMVEPTQSTLVVMAPTDTTPATANGWWAENARGEADGIFEVMAHWINRLLPLGGVEAGRIGR